MGKGVESLSLFPYYLTFNAQEQVVQSKDALTRDKRHLKNQNYTSAK